MTASSSAASPAARDRLALALDVPELDQAVKLADRLSPWFGVAKVGLELFVAAGPDAVRSFVDRGIDVFLDLKLHDIPTTVERASAAAGRLGVRYLNAHAAGGEAMLRAGVEGLRDTAPDATLLGVTVLTSDADAGAFDARLAAAINAGCGGVVCSAFELARVRAAASSTFVTVVPGVRPTGSAMNDQARATTPGDAIAAGASLLVVGRAVTHASDVEAAARAVHDEVAAAMRV
jgi:orotidine-5'-phosphate decarboxylase